MTQAERGPVVIDTGVFGARLTRRTKPLAAAYRPLRDSRPAIISFVTVAELRFGAKLAGWGQTRLQQLEHELDQADTAWAGAEPRRGVCHTACLVRQGRARPGAERPRS